MRRWDERRPAALGMVNGTVGYLLLATPWLPLALAGSFVRGFALPWAVVAAYTLAQRLTPANLQGRVAAALSFAVFATQPLAPALGAAVIGYADYRLLYAGAAAVGLACAVVLWRGSGR
jgi:predicted MFS family arabinose efflux permease